MPFIISLILSLIISFGLGIICCELDDRKHYNLASITVAILILIPLTVFLIYYSMEV